MNGKRLVYLINEAEYFFSHRLRLAEAARTAGWSVHVIVPFVSESMQERFIEAGFPIDAIWRKNNIIDHFLTPYRLCLIVNRIRPDMIHIVTLKCTLIWAVVAPLYARLKTIHTIAGFGQWKYQNFLNRTVRKLLDCLLYFLSHCTNAHFIAQNPEDAADLCANRVIPSHRLHLVMGSGVDTKRFTPADRPGKLGILRVGTAARCLTSKGIPALAAVARYAREHGLPLRFTVAHVRADGHRDAIPTQQWQEWLANDLFEDAGEVADMPAFYQNLDAFLYLSTYGEGLAKTLLEAAACTLPIVTTNQAGCREAVLDGQSGWLMPPHDPAGIAAKLMQWHDDPAQRMAMGNAGRAHIINALSDEIVIAQTLKLYGKPPL